MPSSFFSAIDHALQALGVLSRILATSLSVISSPFGFSFLHFIAYTKSPQEANRSEEHTSELQSRFDLVCRLLLEKKKGQPCRGRSRAQSSAVTSPGTSRA